MPFITVSEPGTSPYTLVLLHGTGGDERSLLELGRAVAPAAPLLGIRGTSRAEGVNRFFRRLAEGVLDEPDVRLKTAELAEFLAATPGEKVALGYSNGANAAAALLLLAPGVLRGALMLRAMLPVRGEPTPDLTGTSALLLSGRTDPFVPAGSAEALEASLREAGAAVERRVEADGHAIEQSDLRRSAAWLAALE